MERILIPGPRAGTVTPPASKSQAHRQLICAALSQTGSVICCEGISDDIEATAACLNGLGADIQIKDNRLYVQPVMTADVRHNSLEKTGMSGNESGQECAAPLMCKESGSTLRFLLPVAGALGKRGVFHMEGRLPDRPLGVFAEELQAHGMQIEKTGTFLKVSGKLQAGTFRLPGNISSQFISGLLMALPLLEEESRLFVTGNVESENYILMTEDTLQKSGIRFQKERREEGLVYTIIPGQRFSFPPKAVTERDWSAATFFLCMGALSEKGITLKGLSLDSVQGDKAVLDLLVRFGAEVQISQGSDGADVTVRKKRLQGIEIDAAGIPDMVPAIAALAAGARGKTVITHAERLRMKESDRLQTVAEMLSALGADIHETEDGLIINGKDTLSEGSIDAAGDHRIAMAAAVAACSCTGEVTVQGSECVSKSYAAFWEDFDFLEQSDQNAGL